LLNFVLIKYETVGEIKEFLDTENSFNGLEGKFSIKNNIVKRELSILQIKNNDARIIK